MFGNNAIAKQSLDPRGDLAIREVFATIQGEGPLAGTPAIFVRLSGCNLRCYFCDTDFDKQRTVRSVKMLAAWVMEEKSKKAPGAWLVVITGGEPLLQNIVPFIKEMCEEHHMSVQIETAGTVWVPGLSDLLSSHLGLTGRLSLVCSPKTGSVHPEIQKHCSHYKYIISCDMGINEALGIPEIGTQRRQDGSVGKYPGKHLFFPASRPATIWLQPCDDHLGTVVEKVNIDLCAALAMKHGYRVSLQQHKIIGLE